MYDIESIKALYKGKAVKFTDHFKNRKKERSIRFSDIESAVLSGEIIEQCLDDYPLPSVLVFGYTTNGKPLHVVLGMDDALLWLITAYFPTLDIWEADYMTRKGVD